MEIIKIEHKDFNLVIECNNLETTFNKARKKQDDIFSSTSYSINEGKIFLYDFDGQKPSRPAIGNTYPLIFENKDYFVGVSFKNRKKIKKAHIFSKLIEIEKKCFYRKELGFLAGTLNFGNDLGKSNLVLRYKKEREHKEVVFQFEVFPTKLNFKSDRKKIITDIEHEYPYLVLDFLKKTFTQFQTGSSPNTDLIWWQVFGGLYEEFIKSSRFVLSKPHTRIVCQSKYEKADRIHKWNSKLEEELSRFHHLPNKAYKTDNKTLSSNTPENRFFKHALFQTFRRYKRVMSFIEQKYGSLISDSFESEMEEIENRLEVLSMNPFFSSIGAFRGFKQESLVLQKATGYSTLYKTWIMLNSGLKFLDGIQKIELKNIADLYQIWCFLEIKNVLQELLGKENPDGVELAEIKIDDFVFQIERGVKSQVTFKNGDEIIDLFHDYSFGTRASSSPKSFTVSQRPDIVLNITKNDLRENYVLTYLYDAKYRTKSDENVDAHDSPPDDAINQMHRYRDAIYYIDDENDKPQKEVIGAYILFPGSDEVERVLELAYFKSIATVNIGAFPLNPTRTSNSVLLKEHLKTVIGLDTEATLSNIHPHKRSIYEPSNPNVLIGFVPSDDHERCFGGSKTPFYFTGARKPSRFGFNKLRYFAPYLKRYGIREYYEIVDYRIAERCAIFEKGHPLYRNENDDRLLITLGKKFTIDRGKYFKISDGSIGLAPYRYTNLKNLKKPQGDKIRVLKVS